MDAQKGPVIRVASLIILATAFLLGYGRASEVRSYQEPADFLKDSEIKTGHRL